MDNSALLPNKGATFPEPLSLFWRVQHNIPYLIGGTTFLIGSCLYLPALANYEAGGWLFTIGSVGFLYADLSEWWKNNKVGCAFDAEYRDDYEAQVGPHCEPADTTLGRYQRAENGINFMYSALGSLLYLIGSILFIPEVGAIVAGTIVFIPGSLVIFTSQMWKLYRAGCNPHSGVVKMSERTFALSNLWHDWPGAQVDLHAGLGGFCYFIGSSLFVPGSGASITDAAAWFIMGGTFFTLSGLFMIYRYYFTTNFAH